MWRTAARLSRARTITRAQAAASQVGKVVAHRFPLIFTTPSRRAHARSRYYRMTRIARVASRVVDPRRGSRPRIFAKPPAWYQIYGHGHGHCSCESTDMVMDGTSFPSVVTSVPSFCPQLFYYSNSSSPSSDHCSYPKRHVESMVESSLTSSASPRKDEEHGAKENAPCNYHE